MPDKLGDMQLHIFIMYVLLESIDKNLQKPTTLRHSIPDRHIAIRHSC